MNLFHEKENISEVTSVGNTEEHYDLPSADRGSVLRAGFPHIDIFKPKFSFSDVLSSLEPFGGVSVETRGDGIQPYSPEGEIISDSDSLDNYKEFYINGLGTPADKALEDKHIVSENAVLLHNKTDVERNELFRKVGDLFELQKDRKYLEGKGSPTAAAQELAEFLDDRLRLGKKTEIFAYSQGTATLLSGIKALSNHYVENSWKHYQDNHGGSEDEARTAVKEMIDKQIDKTFQIKLLGPPLSPKDVSATIPGVDVDFVVHKDDAVVGWAHLGSLQEDQENVRVIQGGGGHALPKLYDTYEIENENALQKVWRNVRSMFSTDEKTSP